MWWEEDCGSPELGLEPEKYSICLKQEWEKVMVIGD